MAYTKIGDKILESDLTKTQLKIILLIKKLSSSPKEHTTLTRKDLQLARTPPYYAREQLKKLILRKNHQMEFKKQGLKDKQEIERVGRREKVKAFNLKVT